MRGRYASYWNAFLLFLHLQYLLDIFSSEQSRQEKREGAARSWINELYLFHGPSKKEIMKPGIGTYEAGNWHLILLNGKSQLYSQYRPNMYAHTSVHRDSNLGA